MKTKITALLLFFMAASAAWTQAQQTDYFYQKNPDGQWIIRSDKETGKSYIHRHIEQQIGDIVAEYPFLIEEACYSADGQQLYLLHSKTFWHSSLSLITTRDWKAQRNRKISDYTEEIKLNADETRLITLARSIVRPLDPHTLSTERVLWLGSRMRLLTPHPSDPYQITVVNTRQDVESIHLNEDTTTIITNTNVPIVSLQYTDTGDSLLMVDSAGHVTFWPQTSTHPLKPVATKPLLGLMPIFSYSPDTRLLLGASSTLLWHPNRTRPTTLTTYASYAFSNQVDIGTEIKHFTPSGWQFMGRSSYQHGIHTQYFGTGMSVDPTIRSPYRQNTFLLTADVLKQVSGPLYVGARYLFRNDGNLTFDANDSPIMPRHYGGSHTGIGLLMRLDSRDHVIFPTQGMLVDASFMQYGHFLGGRYAFQEVLTDFRYYYPLRGFFNQSILALQAFYHHTFGDAIPFYSLPYLGNDRILRGSWRNLYMDKQATGVQGEIRGNFKNIDPRFGYVLFAGAGHVSPTFGFNAFNEGLIGVVGAGYRWQLIPKQRLHFRIDVSLSTKGDVGVLSGIGTAF